MPRAGGFVGFVGDSLCRTELLPALQRMHQLVFDRAVARLQRNGRLQVSLVERAIGQSGADVGLLGFECLDAGGLGVQFALVFVAEFGFWFGLRRRFGLGDGFG